MRISDLPLLSVSCVSTNNDAFQDRMTPEWKTFAVETLDQDKIVLLFDMLYEHRQVFKQQYWMGIITMQNPFDMYSIQDIIYTTRPDLLIETGVKKQCPSCHTRMQPVIMHTHATCHQVGACLLQSSRRVWLYPFP